MAAKRDDEAGITCCSSSTSIRNRILFTSQASSCAWSCMVWKVLITFTLNNEICNFGVLWLTIVFSNRDASLHCDYDTQGEDIYSVKWYKASVPSLKSKMNGTFKTRWSSSSRVVKKYSDGFPRSLTTQLPFIRGLASGLTRCNFVLVLIPVFLFVIVFV